MASQWASPDASRLHAMHHRPSTAEAAKFRLGTLLWFAGITLLLVPMATLLDIPIAKWFAQEPLPSWVGLALEGLLYYAHGTGIAVILLGLLLFAPSKRWNIPRLAVLAAGGGAVSTLTKMFVLRPRPNSLFLSSANNDSAWIWSFDWTLNHIADFEPSSRAFPSAYLATATALTVGLWTLYPRGKMLFATLCLGTLMQRIYCGSHFLSDLCGSAAIGLWWSYVCYHPRLMGSMFEKLESDYDTKAKRKIPPASLNPESDPPDLLNRFNIQTDGNKLVDRSSLQKIGPDVLQDSPASSEEDPSDGREAPRRAA